MSVSIFNDSLAMRQIEYAQRLTYYLIDYIVVAAMLTGTRQGTHRSNIGCRHLHSVIFTTQREEFVLLPGEIHIDIQFHVLLLDRSEGNADLQTLVAHRTQVCQQFIIGKRRNRHIIGIEHVGGLGIVIFCRQNQPVVPQSQISSNIPGSAGFPLQIRIVIANHSHRNRRRTVHRNNTILPHRIQSGIRRYSAKIT